ncbi:hypothetical protein [Moraxella lacunata]|uniref:hypothetical protein n=1 Tax=Moraxella lacunata TaxID=477 RepID=UPI003EDE9C85
MPAYVFSLKNVRFFSFFIANTKGRHTLNFHFISKNVINGRHILRYEVEWIAIYTPKSLA